MFGIVTDNRLTQPAIENRVYMHQFTEKHNEIALFQLVLK